MSAFAAACQLFYGLAFIVGAIPMTVMMACFCCDSGKPDRRMLVFVVIDMVGVSSSVLIDRQKSKMG